MLETLREINLKGDSENFLKIKETLTRIGVSGKNNNTLYQSCHILHKRGKYYIVHFKELFRLDGKAANFTEEDQIRRDTIVNLLFQWGLCDVVDKNPFKVDVSLVKIVSHSDKKNWMLIPKYTVGKK